MAVTQFPEGSAAAQSRVYSLATGIFYVKSDEPVFYDPRKDGLRVLEVALEPGTRIMVGRAGNLEEKLLCAGKTLEQFVQTGQNEDELLGIPVLDRRTSWTILLPHYDAGKDRFWSWNHRMVQTGAVGERHGRLEVAQNRGMVYTHLSQGNLTALFLPESRMVSYMVREGDRVEPFMLGNDSVAYLVLGGIDFGASAESPGESLSAIYQNAYYHLRIQRE